MKYAMSILFLSGSLVFGLLYLAMAIGGVKTGKVYHTAGSPPILFKVNPVKFVVWTMCLVGMSAGFLYGSIVIAKAIMRML